MWSLSGSASASPPAAAPSDWSGGDVFAARPANPNTAFPTNPLTARSRTVYVPPYEDDFHAESGEAQRMSAIQAQCVDHPLRMTSEAVASGGTASSRHPQCWQDPRLPLTGSDHEGCDPSPIAVTTVLPMATVRHHRLIDSPLPNRSRPPICGMDSDTAVLPYRGPDTVLPSEPTVIISVRRTPAKATTPSLFYSTSNTPASRGV